MGRIERRLIRFDPLLLLGKKTLFSNGTLTNTKGVNSAPGHYISRDFLFPYYGHQQNRDTFFVCAPSGLARKLGAVRFVRVVSYFPGALSRLNQVFMKPDQARMHNSPHRKIMSWLYALRLTTWTTTLTS